LGCGVRGGEEWLVSGGWWVVRERGEWWAWVVRWYADLAVACVREVVSESDRGPKYHSGISG
jgi:hypothetical protein